MAKAKQVANWGEIAPDIASKLERWCRVMKKAFALSK